uniref:Uncharacterized protein n=1 Tax=Utricularia reniformis TaxID=192314 RepID=A0A1Y0B048_9LAMI|nr:hypothetical protein AEK19_MT0503 [Utricularia reniformis]ART30759.1 hypothetical protein AEK19_MT0503 [Utricularia reniformis]
MIEKKSCPCRKKTESLGLLDTLIIRPFISGQDSIKKVRTPVTEQ